MLKNRSKLDLHPSVGVIDVGIGNIASIQRMVEKAGHISTLAKKPDELRGIQKIILPGVGHFDEGIKQLQKLGFTQFLVEHIRERNVHLMGICLGMQMLCRSSEEGTVPGLGLINAHVKKFRFPQDNKLKVPHMGWNIVSSPKANPLLPPSPEEQRFYFVHSYKVVLDDTAMTIGTTNYGGEFCAAFQKKNIFGVQVHPEKSHRFGMELIRRFVEL